ncbi:hypothetical protein PRK78_005230 [Emydomyces testavorans]|uniref:Mnd1 HTH domain-containing protein n=1 Tax=Emydomyces testavorans TaxID=2070801 RepID=A0AAF0DMY9_9EURO|nr:hypothetical protein PRK78_005230 [Emydomyces testavorans]
MNRHEDAAAVPKSVEQDTKTVHPEPRRRFANVYDAVAAQSPNLITGRVSTQKFRSAPSLEDVGNLPKTFPSVPPDEVLFRRLSAPTRYEEDDIYFANEHLPPDQTLPDSDLLKAIHTYTSDFYSNATVDHGRSVWSSMDETALLAMGILLEETTTEALGKTGDMVFVEGEEAVDDTEPGYESEASVAAGRRSVSRTWGSLEPDAARTRIRGVGGKGDEVVRTWNRRKKRRLSDSGRSRDERIDLEYLNCWHVEAFQLERCSPSPRAAYRLDFSTLSLSSTDSDCVPKAVTSINPEDDAFPLRFQQRNSTPHHVCPSLRCSVHKAPQVSITELFDCPLEGIQATFCAKMGPSKSLPPAAKQALILAHLRSTRTCHTLKDLEKMLPSVASINGMQVKDYIQALADDGKIQVEKIGSGNWYWAWAAEEKKERDKVRSALAKDLEKINRAVAELESKVGMAKEEAGYGQSAEEEAERAELLAKKAATEAEVIRLKRELDQYESGKVGGDIDMMEADIKRWKAEVEMWTDNIYILEEYMKKLVGGDREVLEALRRECYGDEYVEGEGLREL